MSREAGNGPNVLISGILRGQVASIDGREYAWKPIFNIGRDHFFCSAHAPDGAEELNRDQVISLINRWLGADRQALAAEGNYTSFPARPPECEECHAPLVQENRVARLA